MKQIVLAAAAALGVTAFAAPAQAALFKWSVDYTGFFAEDASISGFFIADGADAADGIVSGGEFESWEWTWSGNSDIEAFTISSSDSDFAFDPGFYVDGTPNEVGLADGLDQGFYSSDDYGLDLEFLFVESFTGGSTPFGGTTSFGDVTAAGTVSVSDPEKVPEPAAILGLLTVAGATALAKRQKQAA
ncbi:pep-cterm motif-containing protein [Leptolyngbya sp. Heron Island J]|uniref:PEP-CTERM sorting domain-containing protein n=1 Tax=Leptolyngbya sp. Heron Island J TaxID=1385935 RepID=UPI0003B9778C|nr:PEP-CTERM sorting domain-containing protein [Leptolyngbya sp. Heron Island J]ESA34663.1 pep-cterm motif-containing protein [Leptolyngbya sp. Heron Island J]